MTREKECTPALGIGGYHADLRSGERTQYPLDPAGISQDALQAVAKEFTGEIWQVLPDPFGRKGRGRGSTNWRKGSSVKLEPRKVFIKEYEVNGDAWPVIRFRVVCSTGTASGAWHMTRASSLAAAPI